MSSIQQQAPLSYSEERQRRWKNPNQVVRIRRKLSRKPSLKSRGSSSGDYSSPRHTPVAAKRTYDENLAPTPPKRLRAGLQDISNSPVAIKTPDKTTTEYDDKPCNQIYKAPPLFSGTPSLPPSTLPTDWSLKTKVRFVSPFPFSWTQSLRPHQEASGLSQFLTNHHHHTSTGTSDRHVDLTESLMVWLHPSLPFLKTFPRHVAETQAKSSLPPPPLLQDPQILQSLKDDWSTSLCSVYQLFKCGQCPYFYLCANHFTVLFISSGERGSPSISAMITPTTSGMREALQKEGAKVNLPLAPRGGLEPDDDISDTEEDGGAANWLATMGLPAQDLPKLRPQRSTLNRPQEARIDNRPESVVMVEGTSSVHVLFNFLLTSKTTITTTGSHAGVPPTILAPSGFKGGTLRSLKMRQGSVKELKEGGMVQRFYLELTGPILPLHLEKLCRLFHSTQSGQFTAHLMNNEPTGAFNGGHTNTDKISDSIPKIISQKTGLREISCENHTFTWS